MITAISKNQQEVLKMLTHEYMTPKQIANRRGTTTQAVYKTIAKLRKKGVLKGGLQKGWKTGGVAKGVGVAKKRRLRLHNIHENIHILASSSRYERLLKKSNKYAKNGITAMLYKTNIQLYTQEGISFYGDTTEECYEAAINFFSKLYAKIENDCGVIIDKERVSNKKWVRTHIALTDSEAAKAANERKERVVIHDRKDGKETWVTDDSYKLNEAESVHPDVGKNKGNMDGYKRFVDDLIHNPSLINSQITSRLQDQLSWNDKMMNIITGLATTSKEHNESIKELMRQ